MWLRAVELAGGKIPTGRIVKDVVQRIMECTEVPNTYQLGEVCQILVKDNPELRGKAGCWGIVSATNEFSCTVRMWDGEYTIGLQHLKSFNYLPEECQQMREVCERITRVYSDSLEETGGLRLRINRLRDNENFEDAPSASAQHLGEVKRPYLTEFEEEILSFIERKRVTRKN